MPDFNWDVAYPSQRMSIMAENVVATSLPIEAQASLEVKLMEIKKKKR